MIDLLKRDVECARGVLGGWGFSGDIKTGWIDGELSLIITYRGGINPGAVSVGDCIRNVIAALTTIRLPITIIDESGSPKSIIVKKDFKFNFGEVS